MQSSEYFTIDSEVFPNCYAPTNEKYASFEEARKHVFDSDDFGGYKYHGCQYKNEQTCEISRYYRPEGMQSYIKTNSWSYINGSYWECFSRVLNKDFAYTGRVW